MPDYRVYCLDGAGHNSLAEWIAADGDEDAIARARKLRPQMDSCQVWQQSRLVAKLNGLGETVER